MSLCEISFPVRGVFPVSMVGGLVLEDDRHFAFVYENGQLSYEEEA